MLAFIKYKHTKNINQSKALEIIAISLCHKNFLISSITFFELTFCDIR